MRHLGYLAATVAALAVAGPAPAQPPATMEPGQRLQLGAMMGERVVRHVMIGENGGITIVYDMPAGRPQSERVLRLENVNGMLEVVYETAMPSPMPLGSGGRPRLVPGGGGMYSVEYDR